MAFVSAAIILMLVIIGGAAPFAYITNSGSNNISVTETIGQFVGKPTPIITWNNPANIIYGTALSSKQLNAIASVPGKFVYTPPLETVLNVGLHQTLTAYFTPTDTANYTNISASVSINVTQAPITNIQSVTTSPITLPSSWKVFNANVTLSNLSSPGTFVVRVPNNPDLWKYIPLREAGQTISFNIKGLISQNPAKDQIDIKYFVPGKTITEKKYSLK